MVKIEIDHNLCIGCGTCESICPEVFEVGEDGKSHVKDGVNLEEYIESIKEAEEDCPEQAITVK